MQSSEEKRIRVCHVATVEFAIRFLLFNQLRYLQEHGYDVSVVCSPGEWIWKLEEYGISYQPISMTRRITPFQDLLALARLIRYFRKEKFSIVHTHTPKAGLLGTTAARIAGVPVIIHTNHGFYFHEYSSGIKKQVFMWIERIVAWNARLVFSVNKEDIATAKRVHIGDERKIKYLGGWANLERFNPERFSEEFISQKKRELGIREDVPVVGIVARLVREKGYFELFEAMETVIARFPNVVLLVVGLAEPEKKDGFEPSVIREYGIGENVRFLGARMDVDELYPVMDVFTLPSHREGIGTSILEASAMARPVVATNVRGCREAVKDGETGILVPHQNSQKLAEALLWMLEHPEEAKLMGKAGKKRIEREFDERLVLKRIDEAYQALIAQVLYAPAISRKRIQAFLKRQMDFWGALTGLVLTSPLLLLIAILIRLDSRGPVLFLQERTGKDGKAFQVYKFRTMVDKAYLQGAGYGIVKEDPRITRVGKFLRSYGLDELPQLWNVLKGEMSFVGPRPLIYPKESYKERLQERFRMRPGMTSYAVVKGRNALSWEDKLEYDVWYVRNWSFWLDLRILLMTIPIIFQRGGDYGEEGIKPLVDLPKDKE